MYTLSSQRQHVTLESSLTVSCRCLHRWPLCVAVAIPATAAPTARPIHVNRGHKDAGSGVHFVSPGLLQLTVLRYRRGSDEAAAICTECGCTYGVGRSTVRPHHASATGAALASGSTSVGYDSCLVVE